MPKKQNQEAKVKKVVEDKTFGLKNKKGKKQQEYVQQVKSQAQAGTEEERKRRAEKELKEKVKAMKEAEQAELNLLFKPVAQTLKVGEDPKSIVCSFFKKGGCDKGAKCKFSHDLAVERKGAKRDIYSDVRDEAKVNDTMDTWDQAKLEDVVKQKMKNGPSQTEVICKHFLDALEKSLYGWFWVCPGGDKCMYRHALPPGYVLKRDKKKAEEAEEKITIEELVERERAALGPNLTPVNLVNFTAWKKKKIEEKRKLLAAENAKKKKSLQLGHMANMTGRNLFEFNPSIAGEDDVDAADATLYVRDETEDVPVVEGEEGEASSNGATEILLDEHGVPLPTTGKVQVKVMDISVGHFNLEGLDYALLLSPKEDDVPAGEDEVASGDAVIVDASVFADEDLGDLDDSESDE